MERTSRPGNNNEGTNRADNTSRNNGRSWSSMTFNFLRDVILRGYTGNTSSDSASQNTNVMDNPQNAQDHHQDHHQPLTGIEQQKHKGMRERISGLLGMDDDQTRLYNWRLVKNEDDFATYITPEIQELMRQKKLFFDTQVDEMEDQFDNGKLLGGAMNDRMNELTSEYYQQEMLLVLDEINRRLDQ